MAPKRHFVTFIQLLKLNASTFTRESPFNLYSGLGYALGPGCEQKIDIRASALQPSIIDLFVRPCSDLRHTLKFDI